MNLAIPLLSQQLHRSPLLLYRRDLPLHLRYLLPPLLHHRPMNLQAAHLIVLCYSIREVVKRKN